MFFLYSFAPKNKHFQWGNQNLSLTPWWSKLFWYHKVSGLTPLRALSHCVSVTHWMEIIVSLMSNMCQGIPSGSQLQLSAFKFGTPFDGNLYNDRASQSPRIRISDGENLWSAALSSKQLWSTLRLRRYWKINKRPLGIPPTVRRRNKCDLTKTQPTFFSERNWYWIPYRMRKNSVKEVMVNLFLNCYCDKFDQQLQLPKIHYFTEQENLSKLLQDCAIHVKGIELLNYQNQPKSDIIYINFIKKKTTTRNLLMTAHLAMSC